MTKRIGVLLALVGLVGVHGLSMIAGAQALPTAEVVIEKVVEGSPPSGTTFRIRVRCVIEEDENNTFTETFNFDEDGGTGSFPVEDEVDCVVTETKTGGASSVDYECEAEGAFTDVECNNDRTFEIDGNALTGDGRVTVTVTNTFDPATAPQAIEDEPTFTG